MSKQANGSSPELVVLGRDDQGKPRAARFPSDQANVVAKAAKAMNLTVAKADGVALAELAKKLPIGRLYATGRGSCRPLGEACTARSSSNCNSPVSRCQRSPIRGTANGPPPDCPQPGMTLPSAIW